MSHDRSKSRGSFCWWRLHILFWQIMIFWSHQSQAEISAIDCSYLEEALRLALRAMGETRPNPIVGCVIVDHSTGYIIGRGWHHRAGEPHAEVNALKDSGLFITSKENDLSAAFPRTIDIEKHTKRQILAAHCTAYVTLEPCNHFGRTPPCTQALRMAGIARVVTAMLDPDSRVAGKGLECLSSYNLTVDVLQPLRDSLDLDLSLDSNLNKTVTTGNDDDEKNVLRMRQTRLLRRCVLGNAAFLHRVCYQRPLLQRLLLTTPHSNHLQSEKNTLLWACLTEKRDFWRDVSGLQDTFILAPQLVHSLLLPTLSGRAFKDKLRDLVWRLHQNLPRSMRIVICFSHSCLPNFTERDMDQVVDATLDFEEGYEGQSTSWLRQVQWLQMRHRESMQDTDRAINELIFGIVSSSTRDLASSIQQDNVAKGIWLIPTLSSTLYNTKRIDDSDHEHKNCDEVALEMLVAECGRRLQSNGVSVLSSSPSALTESLLKGDEVVVLSELAKCDPIPTHPSQVTKNADSDSNPDSDDLADLLEWRAKHGHCLTARRVRILSPSSLLLRPH